MIVGIDTHEWPPTAADILMKSDELRLAPYPTNLAARQAGEAFADDWWVKVNADAAKRYL